MKAELDNNLRIALFVQSGTAIPSALIKKGFEVVGIIENQSSTENKQSSWFKKILKGIRPLKQLADARQLEYHLYDDQHPSKTAEWLSSLSADILISHLAPILPAKIFEAPRLGSINIHPSLLPKFRGSNPFFWVYYHREQETGITIHRIDQNIDTGQIICQRRIKVTKGQDGVILGRKMLTECAIPALIETLQRLSEGESLQQMSSTQPTDSPTEYARRVSDEEYRDLLSDASFSIEHVWHTMHSNWQWRSALLPLINQSGKFDWRLGSFSKQKTDVSRIDVCKNNQKFSILHPNGTIELHRQFNWKKYIKHSLGLL